MTRASGKKLQLRQRLRNRKKQRRIEKHTKKQGFNRHHRRPKKYRGKMSDDNISWVNIKKHKAWHALFWVGYPVIRVARIINETWLCLSFVMIPIKTKDITRALELLHAEGIIDTTDKEHYGITQKHLRRFGSDEEKARIEANGHG